MRFLSACIFVVSAAVVVYSVRAIDARGRPLDVVFGLVAPVAALVAAIALVGILVPGFL